MTVFNVWAPKAQQVELKTGERLVLMEKQAGGWWQLDLPAARPGDDYAYVLDGSSPFPDPRSPWQPNGVHAASRLVNHADFNWTDAGWQAPPLASAVVYELHVGTFSPQGTFEGAINYLDHLVALGVTHVELLPVAEFPGERGWGYDGVALFAPHHAYGGPQGLKRLVEACHARRLAVLLDVVYNHLGPDGNYLGQYGPYFTDRHKTLWGEAVNFDGPGSDEVRRFFFDNALMWLRDYHIDGLRLDAVHAIVDTSAIHFLEELRAEVDQLSAQLGRHLVLIAESDLNDPRIIRSPEAGGYGMDAQWSDDFHHALHSLLTGEQSGYYADFGSFDNLANALQEGYVYNHRYAVARGRQHGRPALGVPAQRFLAYLQNHDQIGNRAQGERSSQLLEPGLLQIAAALVVTSPFVPMLFMGEEWAASTPFLYFTDHQDRDLGEAVSHGRKEEFAAFGWDAASIPDPQDKRTFKRSRLQWEERERSPHAELLAWHTALIRLRATLPDLRRGWYTETRVHFNDQERWLVVQRGRLRLACNLDERRHTVHGGERIELPSAAARIHLASHAAIHLDTQGVHLPPRSVVIFE